MPNPTKPEFAKRKLIDSLEQVSIDIVDYTSNPENLPDLTSMIKEVDKQYNGDRNSWFFRVRVHSLNSLVATLNQTVTPTILMEALETFFSSGAWEPAKTTLMLKMIDKLPDYDKSDADTLTEKELVRVKELLIRKAWPMLAMDRFMQSRISQLQEEIQTLPKRNIKLEAAEYLKILEEKRAASFLPKSDARRINIYATEENQIIAAALPSEAPIIVPPQAAIKSEHQLTTQTSMTQLVEGCLREQSQSEVQPVKAEIQAPAGKRKVGRIHPDTLRDYNIKLGNALESKAAEILIAEDNRKKYKPGKLSPAAFETPNVQPFVAKKERQKIVLTTEQAAAMAHLRECLFAKIIQPDQDVVQHDTPAMKR